MIPLLPVQSVFVRSNIRWREERVLLLARVRRWRFACALALALALLAAAAALTGGLP